MVLCRNVCFSIVINMFLIFQKLLFHWDQYDIVTSLNMQIWSSQKNNSNASSWAWVWTLHLSLSLSLEHEFERKLFALLHYSLTNGSENDQHISSQNKFVKFTILMCYFHRLSTGLTLLINCWAYLVHILSLFNLIAFTMS